MNSAPPQANELQIRPFQHRDLDRIGSLLDHAFEAESPSCSIELEQQLQQVRRWYGILKCLSLVPNPLRDVFSAYVAEHSNNLYGMVQVSPINVTRSTWRVDRVVSNGLMANKGTRLQPTDVGSQLLRYCFESIWEARTWVLEVDVNHKGALGLYHLNGFQRLAEMTYWAISPDSLEALANHEPKLPNLLPVSNADACLLHQLDTVAMLPPVRQVFDRQPDDFKVGLFESLVEQVQRWITKTETIKAYVFEPQRKAAIGYFKLDLCKDGSHSHKAELTVHPAYTWLYPELLAQMAQVTQAMPKQTLQLTSTDYQPEREEYLEQVGALRTQHTLLLSRSVWHKLKETRPVALERQLAEVLQGWQPTRTPVPSRSSHWLNPFQFMGQRHRLFFSQRSPFSDPHHHATPEHQWAFEQTGDFPSKRHHASGSESHSDFPPHHPEA